MSQHGNQNWPWPTYEESERLTRLLREPETLSSPSPRFLEWAVCSSQGKPPHRPSLYG